MIKYYITTAIPYVNAAPHIGHALEFLQTDCIKRFQKLLGKDTFLTSGSDENSLKNVQSAEKAGVTPQELCAMNAERFKELARELNVGVDFFLRSSASKEHVIGVQKLWKLCDESNDIYKKKYKGLYCVGCEAFYKESELTAGKCPEHLKEPEVVEEENYFFRLSKYQKELQKLIEADKIRVIPETRKNEVLGFIKQGLEDFSISRSVERARGWGIPVPGDKTQIMYVWYDALSIYMTSVGYGSDERLFKKLWPADMHVIGKGILRFHAVYWPAMLLSAGLPLPKAVFTHGYINVDGQKMSKTLGNVVNPFEMLNKYGIDSLRYFMLKEIPPYDDGNFSEKNLVEMSNSELVANVGNFVNRTLTFIEKYFDCKVPLKGILSKNDNYLTTQINSTIDKTKVHMEDVKLKDALTEIMKLSSIGNKYFQDNKPWELINDDKKRAGTVIYLCANLCNSLAVMLWPFIPNASEQILDLLNIELSKLSSIEELKSGHKIKKPKIIFKKFGV